MLLKRSKEYIKNVDHMVINHNIATVIEFIFCKMRVWKGYFCNWFRKNWPTLTSSPHWTTTKYWILPFLVPPTRISEKIPPPPLTCLVWNRGSPFTKGEGEEGNYVPAVELDNVIRFSTLSRMSRFLRHSSKWAHRFGRFLQYTSGLEVLACSLDTDLNYVTTMLQLRLSLNH